MQDYKIQIASQNDLERIFEISSTVHLANYRQFISNKYIDKFTQHYRIDKNNTRRFVEFVGNKMKNPNYKLYKAVIGDVLIVGYLSIEIGKKISNINSVFVDPLCQGRGVGKALMEKVIQDYGNGTFELVVLKQNKKAIALYEKFGFIIEGRQPTKSFYGASLLHMNRP